jgi:hypothetical protein
MVLKTSVDLAVLECVNMYVPLSLRELPLPRDASDYRFHCVSGSFSTKIYQII